VHLAAESGHHRLWMLALVALAAFLAGLLVGRMAALRGTGDAGAEPAPAPVPHPRSLNP
jgi:hypothetical protein